MVKTKPIGDIAKKWGDVTPGRSSYFSAGVKNPKIPWSQGAIAAAEAWSGGVQKAVSDKRFAGGVRRAGDEKWTRKASTVGVDRFGPGVMAAQPDFEAGVTPFIQVIEQTTLPSRKMRGDPANIERVSKMATALAQKRLALKAAG